MPTTKELQKKDMLFLATRSWQEQGRKYVEGVASDETVDRAGDVILATAWQLDNFLKNPVLLWAHDYKTPPVGKVVDIWVENGKLKFRAEFANTDFAREIANLYSDGYLNTFSVGFLPVEYEPNKETGGYVYKKVELLEISAVPVPANPNAVAVLRAKGLEPIAIEDQQKGGEEMDEVQKGVIPYKKYPLAPEDTPWNAAAEVRKAEPKDLHEMCAWYDEENADTKQAYKLPHHKKDRYATVWRGVAAAMAALFGARGGVNIPEKDKKGVYNHLAKHYKDFDKTPPEWGKSWEEVKGMFDFLTDEEIDSTIKAFEEVSNAEEVEEQMEDKETPETVAEQPQEMENKGVEYTEEKAGAVLSRKNAEKLKALAGKVNDAIQVLSEAVKELTDFVDSTTKRTQEEETEEEEKLFTAEEVREILEAYRIALLKEIGGETDE